MLPSPGMLRPGQPARGERVYPLGTPVPSHPRAPARYPKGAVDARTGTDGPSQEKRTQDSLTSTASGSSASCSSTASAATFSRRDCATVTP